MINLTKLYNVMNQIILTFYKTRLLSDTLTLDTLYFNKTFGTLTHPSVVIFDVDKWG